MTADGERIAPDVALIALVQDSGGMVPVTLLIPGATPMFCLTAMAMQALAKQTEYGGKPIVALRYQVER